MKFKKTWTRQSDSADKVTTLNETVNNANELPPENQELLLMTAMLMKYAHDCVVGQRDAEKRLGQRRYPDV